MRHQARLNRLEERLSLGSQKPPVMMCILLDGDVPEWATEAMRPYIAPEGVTIITWRKATDGQLYAEIRGAWHHVTPDGCPRIEVPDLITFSVGPDR